MFKRTLLQKLYTMKKVNSHNYIGVIGVIALGLYMMSSKFLIFYSSLYTFLALHTLYNKSGFPPLGRCYEFFFLSMYTQLAMGEGGVHSSNVIYSVSV